jgi:hypothetical protein
MTASSDICKALPTVPLEGAKRSQLQSHPKKNRPKFVCSFSAGGHTTYAEYDIDHTHLDHGYIKISYLNNDIKGNIYSYTSATTSVNIIRVITYVHDTPVVTTGGKRRHQKGR